MGLLARFQTWLTTRSLRRQFRYPALAEANKALLTVEAEVVDFQQINYQMDAYKKVLAVPEKDRDMAYIPVYLAIERYVIDHRPPQVKQVMSKDMVRDRVRQTANMEVMSEPFRLLFMSGNEQADHLLKIGIADPLRFLLTSLGKIQLAALIKRAAGSTPLGQIVVSDDGLNFDRVHLGMRKLPKPQILAAYEQFYKTFFDDITNVFGQKTAIELMTAARKKIESSYDSDLVSIYINILPDAVRRL